MVKNKWIKDFITLDQTVDYGILSRIRLEVLSNVETKLHEKDTVCKGMESDGMLVCCKCVDDADLINNGVKRSPSVHHF